MVRTKIPILIAFLSGIQFSITQDYSFLSTPWVDVVQTPEVAPVIVAMNSSCVTPIPNTFNRFTSSSKDQPIIMFNTGKSLYVHVASTTPYTSYTMGGALGLDEYQFNSLVFLWDLNLGNAGLTLDGVGSPLQIIVFHTNLKYAPQDASNHLDGLYLQNIRVNIVDGAPYSDTFTTFEQKIKQITEPGTNVTLTRGELDWFQPSPIRMHEYCYPGSVRNPTTNTITHSAVCCVTLDENLMTISQSQFLEIFGLLLNESGESFNNVRAPQNISPDTPIGSFGPVVGTTQLDSEK